MIGKFYESFGREKDEAQKLPDEIIDILNERLPDSFMYVLDKAGEYRAVPRMDKLSNGIKFTTQFGFDEKRDAELIEKLKRIPRDKWDEYFYRTQMRIPIKNVKIGSDNKVIPFENLYRDPLEDRDNEVMSNDEYFLTYVSLAPIQVKFESPEGDSVEIGIQQQAYDSLGEIKFVNVDFLAMKIELYKYSPLVYNCCENAHTSVNNQLVVNYSVTPSQAESVKDAVVALRIFRGLFNGTTKVNGHTISSEGSKCSFEPKKIEDALTFWETALQLEEKLSVKFDPKSNFPEEDMRFFTNLQTCLLGKKNIVWKHPFYHFHVRGFYPSREGITLEEMIGKDSISFEFLEGPIPATLLGAEFAFYRRIEMKNFVITNIAWDDEKKETGEIYISDLPDKQWVLTQLYMTEADIKEFKRS